MQRPDDQCRKRAQSIDMHTPRSQSIRRSLSTSFSRRKIFFCLQTSLRKDKAQLADIHRSQSTLGTLPKRRCVIIVRRVWRYISRQLSREQLREGVIEAMRHNRWKLNVVCCMGSIAAQASELLLRPANPLFIVSTVASMPSHGKSSPLSPSLSRSHGWR